MENICAQVNPENELKFTLIDFGVCSKLPEITSIRVKKAFRGNFVFSSFNHLIYGRAN